MSPLSSVVPLHPACLSLPLLPSWHFAWRAEGNDSKDEIKPNGLKQAKWTRTEKAPNKQQCHLPSVNIARRHVRGHHCNVSARCFFMCSWGSPIKHLCPLTLPVTVEPLLNRGVESTTQAAITLLITDQLHSQAPAFTPGGNNSAHEGGADSAEELGIPWEIK